MTMTTRNDLDALDLLFHEVALSEADSVSTRAERRQERDILAAVRAMTAATRRARYLDEMTTPEPMSLGALPAKLLLWTRDALLARIVAIAETNPGAVRYAHQELSGLSDNDLRRLVQMLEYPLHDEEAS